MRVIAILLVLFFISGCVKTDIQRCVEAQMRMYDALKKDQPKKFVKRFCKTVPKIKDAMTGEKVYPSKPNDTYCTTREEHEASQSRICLFSGTRTQ